MGGNIDGEKGRLWSPIWAWPHLHPYQHVGVGRQGSLGTHSKESGIRAGRTIAGRISKWWWEVRHLQEID